MPVFNGEKYLEETLESILAQTYTDFELIISDNASTDRTEQICLGYASKDARIRYYRNERNVGAPNNYNRVFKLSSSRYFKWAAYDDLLAPTYMKKCVDVLDKDPSVVLCHSKTGRIDEHGAVVGNYDHTMRIDSQKPHERFGDLISILDPCWPIFGVMHRNILGMTPLHGSYMHADRNLLAEISLYGRMYEIPEYLFLRRDHPEAYTQRHRGQHQFATSMNKYSRQMSWWTNDSWTKFPTLKNFLEFLRSAGRVPLKRSERLLCYEQVYRWFFREGWKLMYSDLELSLLRRSSFGRKVASAVKLMVGRTPISTIGKERENE
jgi:glycosyltransferase involved in cell wall biosynthesis